MAALRQLAVFIYGPEVLNDAQWLENTLPLLGDVHALLRTAPLRVTGRGAAVCPLNLGVPGSLFFAEV